MNHTGLTPETQLLLCCAPGDDVQRGIRVQELLALPLDWQQVRRLAARHRLLPLLFWKLQSQSAQLPPEVVSWLRQEFDTNATRNFALITRLQEILSLFAADGIQALAYKGPALAMEAYGNVLLRSYCDLDLLLKPQDIPQAGAILAQNGFQQTIHAGEESNDYAQQWQRDAGMVVVELHWNILARHEAPPLDLSGVWERPARVNVSGVEVLAPAHDDLLLILAWHGYKHHWTVLEWVLAFAQVVTKNGDCDWEQLLEKAAHNGSRRVLLIALGLAHQLFEVPLAPPVLRALERDAAIGALVQQLLGSLFPELAIPGAGFYHLRARERWRDKARYLWRLAQTPEQIAKPLATKDN